MATINAKTVQFGRYGALFIKEGGQLVYNGKPFEVTMMKTIKAASKETNEKSAYGGWYTISSPVNEPDIRTKTNLVTPLVYPYNFDLLLYDEPHHTWGSFNGNSSLFTSDVLENGRGYLYRNGSDLTVQYTGDIVTEDVSCYVTCTDDDDNKLQG